MLEPKPKPTLKPKPKLEPKPKPKAKPKSKITFSDRLKCGMTTVVFISTKVVKLSGLSGLVRLSALLLIRPSSIWRQRWCIIFRQGKLKCAIKGGGRVQPSDRDFDQRNLI